MVVKHFITIKIKISNHLLEIARLKFAISVLTLELSEGLRIDEASAMTVDSPEGTIGLEVFHC